MRDQLVPQPFGFVKQVTLTSRNHTMFEYMSISRQFITLAVAILCSIPVWAAEQSVQVADPYVDIRTGPGKGYPKFYVAEQGEWMVLLKRRAGWFKVQLENDKLGWVSEKQLLQTLAPSGEVVNVDELEKNSAAQRPWQLGVSGGEFGGADLVSVLLAYQFTENISTELTLSQALGTFSNNYLYDVSVLHTAFPHWKVIPYLRLGGGQIKTDPNATLVETEDRTDSTFHAGIGLAVPLAKRFQLRFEYRNYLITTGRDDDEEIEQWRIGLNTAF